MGKMDQNHNTKRSHKQIPPITIEEARIIFRNFAGRGGPFNSEGDRNFSVLIPPEMVDQLREDGWNVKTLRPREEGDEPAYHLPVKVSFGSRPPTIVLITSRGRTTLDEARIELLDWVDMANVDLMVRPYTWEVGGRTGVRAYLKSIYVTIAEDYLERKYSSVPEVGRTETLAIEASPPWEGEVIDEH